MSKPIAVLISDVHYNINTLELADAAMRQAIAKANSLEVPLIVAGDLHDTKANMRGECVNAMLETFSLCKIQPFVLVGNHDRLNEKSPAHALNFLKEVATIIESHTVLIHAGFRLIPYYHDPEELKAYLKTIPGGSIVIMHQGVQGSDAGDYIQDKTALPKECFKDFRVISGHYHRRQNIHCSTELESALNNGAGVFSYIGNPYTLNYGEANDPEKGFQILMDDGSLKFVPTNLRKHVVWEVSINEIGEKPLPQVRVGDLLWIKIKGTRESLVPFTKDFVSKALELTGAFKLDLIPTDTETTAPEQTKELSQGELLDAMVDSLSNTSNDQKERLKSLWKGKL